MAHTRILNSNELFPAPKGKPSVCINGIPYPSILWAKEFNKVVTIMTWTPDGDVTLYLPVDKVTIQTVR